MLNGEIGYKELSKRIAAHGVEFGMLGYLLHGIAAAAETLVPWVVRHAVSPCPSVSASEAEAEAGVAASAAIAIVHGALMGLLACMIDTNLGNAALLLKDSAEARALDDAEADRSRAYARRRRARREDEIELRDRQAVTAARGGSDPGIGTTLRRPAYLMGVGGSVSCASALLPAHVAAVPILVCLFAISAACGAGARTNLIIKASRELWRERNNQGWSLAHDPETSLRGDPYAFGDSRGPERRADAGAAQRRFR